MPKLRPCDCRDEVTQKRLADQGIMINDQSLYLDAGKVVFKKTGLQVTIPLNVMKAFAHWFLEEQDVT